MCKWWAPQLAYDAIHQCLLMHGHGGYDRGPMEQRLRDVLGFQIGDGTAQIMKTIIARSHRPRRGAGLSATRPVDHRRPPRAVLRPAALASSVTPNVNAAPHEARRRTRRPAARGRGRRALEFRACARCAA